MSVCVFDNSTVLVTNDVPLHVCSMYMTCKLCSTCCFNLLFTGMVRVGVKIPQDGNRTNVYGHVAMVHGHVWRTLCSVFALSVRFV